MFSKSWFCAVQHYNHRVEHLKALLKKKNPPAGCTVTLQVGQEGLGTSHITYFKQNWQTIGKKN